MEVHGAQQFLENGVGSESLHEGLGQFLGGKTEYLYYTTWRWLCQDNKIKS